MKTNRNLTLFTLFLAALFTLTACGGSGGGGLFGGPTVTISIVYGSEKESWLEPLVEEFNNANNTVASGTVIRVESTPMGSIESAREIVAGTLQATVWSPASSIYVPVANTEWRKNNATDLFSGDPKDLVLSPVVIAMWRPMAEALGWPATPIGWEDIAELSTSDEGWAAYGYPEWGDFKLGHTHPDFSNSGITAIIAEAYAGAGKQRDLTLADLQDPDTRAFVEAVESSIIHYGSSTGFFATRMFNNGPSYLSAAVLYENLIVEQEAKRLRGEVSQIPVVAIYPEEGTFWSNHPYIILNAPWVTEEQREAAEIFEAFLLAEPQQRRAIELGFRPALTTIPLTSPLDANHGVDINQPQTILEIPDADVIAGISQLWAEVKKPVDVIVVMDISGSMSGEKISSARASLVDFIGILDDRDRLQIMLFSSDINNLTELTELGPKRDDLSRRVTGIIEQGGTRLYDSVIEAYRQMEANGDPDRIRAIVVLTDGVDTESTANLQQVLQTLNTGGEGQGGNSIKLFTIAFGSDADSGVLQQIVESTGGRQYDSDPTTITKIYRDIATFF